VCLLAAPISASADQEILTGGAAGDGQMQIRGDQYGAFGPFSVSDAGFGNYDPDGALGLRPWAFWSGLMLTDGESWQWLMDADDWPGDFGERMLDDEVISDESTASSRTSSFGVSRLGDLQVDLVQELSQYNILQTYTFHNLSNSPRELKALWETDVDMEFAQGAQDNLAGIGLDENPRVYFIEASDVAGEGDPGVADRARRISVIAETGENISLEGVMAFRTPVGSGGATHLHFYAQRMFGVEEDFLNSVQEILGGGNGQPVGEIDGNGDNLMDESGDVGGAMQFLLELPANGSATLTLNFVGGSLSNAVIGNPTIPGDYNANGELDAADLDLQAIQIAADPGDPAYDLTNDGVVDTQDREAWVHDLKHTWIGDADLNGEFNSTDLVDVLASGTYEVDVPSGWAAGDFSGDGRTDSSDLVAALADGGYEQGPRPAVSAVPEPTACTLMLLGLMGIYFRRRQQPA
jgi:hypothetical protein